ncbi:MAG: hypothetical protein N0A24_10185 [Armatimonadetes bacterium]|nr:hypothetical protein [Armatimonadota bacterium]MDW8154541.1 hypothetical protein [Armatimonadota bacterium]
MSSIIAAAVAEEGVHSLKAPIKQVTGLEATIPYSKPMEEYVIPSEERIIQAVREVLAERAAA